MNKIGWTVTAALCAGPIVANAQLPTSKVRLLPQITAAQIAQPAKLSRVQLLSRLRNLSVDQAATTPASPAPTPTPTPRPTPTPTPMPTIVERETLSIEQMVAGASAMRLVGVDVVASTLHPARVNLASDSMWLITFRGSGNPYAIDCTIGGGPRQRRVRHHPVQQRRQFA